MDRPRINLDKLKNRPTINEKLDAQYGKVGTKERAKFEKEALDFYASQILYFSRKEAKLTQKALSEKTGIDKSYISRIENGLVQPTVGTFLKLLQAMELRFDIGKIA